MADPPKKQPPMATVPEWPVDDADLEAMADAALDEPGYEPDDDFVRGGPSLEEGFAGTMARARQRAARLQSGVPDVRQVVSFRRKKAFLMSLAQTGNITIACAAAGWSRSVPNSLRKADKDFAERMDFAVETSVDLLIGAAQQRAVHGVTKDVWHKPKEGEPMVIGQDVVYSDRLLEMLIKAGRPEKFNPGQNIKLDTGSKGGVLVVPGTMGMAEFSEMAFKQQAQFREKRED